MLLRQETGTKSAGSFIIGRTQRQIFVAGNIRLRCQINGICLRGCIIRHLFIVRGGVKIVVHPQPDVRVDIIAKRYIILPRTVAEGHVLLADTHHVDSIGVGRIDQIGWVCAVDGAVFNSLDLRYVEIKITVFRFNMPV